MNKLANELNIRPSDFIFESTPQEAASLHAKIITDFELMNAIKGYYQLSPQNQKMVRDLIENLKKTGD